MAEVPVLLDQAEEDVTAVVSDVLAEVAAEFADNLAAATELVAARFSVSRIAGMFTSRLPRIVRSLLGVAEQAAENTAASLDADLPDGWDDLPARYDDGRPLPAPMSEYVDITEHLLRAVGERLAAVAREELATGVDAGEDMEQLRARLRAAFAREGSELGDMREERVARTEAGRAWNTATLAAARALQGPDRPLVKQWITRRDTRVREDHDDANGQLRLLDEPFTIGPAEMSAPHDPTAPASQVVNCFPGDTLVQAPSGVRRIYRRWYEGPLIEVHTKDGGKLAGTPNHPLLTDAGWKPLQGVELGDQLVGTPRGVRVGTGDPDVEHGPASLAELYRAAHEAGVASGVVRGGVDFHGDIADGDVEVVGLHGDLRTDFEPAALQGRDDVVLRLPRGGLGDLTGGGNRRRPQETGRRTRAAVNSRAAGLVRGGSQRSALLEREALHAEPVSLTAGPDCHASIEQAFADGRAAHVEGAGQGELGLSGVVSAHDLLVVDVGAGVRSGELDSLGRGTDLHPGLVQGAADAADAALVDPGKVRDGLADRVALHEVRDIQRRWFSGHVYNLETGEGWYTANDIASHNCRCVLAVSPSTAAASLQSKDSSPTAISYARPTPPGPYDALRARLVADLGDAAAAAGIANVAAWDRHPAREAGAPTPGSYSLAWDSRPLNVLAADASGTPRTGAMIALLPTDADADRLALEGGEEAGELHLTLWYLGDGADWDEDQRRELIAGLRSAAASLPGPFTARAFGVNHWNPGSESPSWVWAVGDERDAPEDTPTLQEVHSKATSALEDTHSHPDFPAPHSPWSPHVCAAYSADTWPLEEMVERVGPITFDRMRVAFAGVHTDIPLGPAKEDDMPEETTAAAAAAPALIEEPTVTRAWSTPGDTALAFEDMETGDGRLFTAGALYWDGPGPWPLQYADEMLMGHEGAELAGGIETISREGQRIPASGVLYLTRPAGLDAVTLLEQEAPLGVSVDLDDVDLEFVDRTLDPEDEDWLFASARLPQASVLRMADGSILLSAATTPSWTASGSTFTRSRYDVQLITDASGTLTASAITKAFAGTGTLTAAAGDADDPEAGIVVHAQKSGDFLCRITRARLRGATLVAMPAYAGARIVLDSLSEEASAAPAAIVAATGTTRDRVITYVRTSPAAVSARDVAKALGIAMTTARTHLNAATADERIVKLAPGLFAGPTTLPEGAEVTAAMSGDLDLPVHEDPEHPWDGDAARTRVLEWATGDDGTVDADKLGAAFLYRDEDADPATVGAYKLGFADVFDDELRIVAQAVYSIASVLEGGMGGVYIPADEEDALRSRVETLYGRLAEAYDDPSITPPWGDEEDMSASGERALIASAWTALSDMPPMPAAWFREPTAEELPPGSGGVHYRAGRVYGWVAQAGEPHAGYPGRKLTIESLGKIDLSHFLRARFALDDGSQARVGAFTMNAPHNRDGAECEDAACQFDDSRTVAGIVTVGMSKGGMWFSGAAAPWLAEWDRQVFQACQPSYHLKQGKKGWQLRAVLSVPVPGHSSPLVATAVAERSNLALAASAAVAATPDTASGHGKDSPVKVSGALAVTRADRPGHGPDTASGHGPAVDVDALTAALLDGPFIERIASAVVDLEAARRAEIDALAASIAPTAQEITASAAPKGDR